MNRLFAATLFLLLASRTHAHEVPLADAQTAPIKEASAAVDLAFHLAVFGGLGVAGMIGLRENRKATGRWISWYRG